MRNNVFNLISSYTNWIIANYQAIAKVNAAMPALRLISEKRDKKTGKIFFKIHITGKNIFPVVSLKDLKDPVTLSNFHKSDQNIILNYLHEDSYQTNNRISARTFDREKKQFVYTIEFYDEESNMMKCKTIDNLSLLLNDLHHFDNEDAFLIDLESNKKIR